MDNEIRRRYPALRTGVTPGAPITVLHMGPEQTAVASPSTLLSRDAAIRQIARLARAGRYKP